MWLRLLAFLKGSVVPFLGLIFSDERRSFFGKNGMRAVSDRVTGVFDPDFPCFLPSLFLTLLIFFSPNGLSATVV